MVLVNGAKGIGTGWSTSIPTFNPEDLVENVRRMIREEPLLELEPWVRGFEGEIEKDTEDGYISKGVWDECDDDTVEITELPLGTFTKDYKEMLEKMISDSKELVDMKELHTRTKVKFEIKFKTGELEALYKSGTFEKKMKLTSTISTSNMVAFDHQGRLQKFSSANDFIRAYYPVRLELYGKRKDYLLRILTQETTVLENKIRFVKMVISGSLDIKNKPKSSLMDELGELGFLKSKEISKLGLDATKDSEGDAFTQDTASEQNNGYNYLLGMPLWNLTKEKVDKLLSEGEEKRREFNILSAKTPKDLWIEDLDRFSEAYAKMVT